MLFLNSFLVSFNLGGLKPKFSEVKCHRSLKLARVYVFPHDPDDWKSGCAGTSTKNACPSKTNGIILLLPQLLLFLEHPEKLKTIKYEVRSEVQIAHNLKN